MLTEEQIKKDVELIAYFLTVCKKLAIDSYCMLVTDSEGKFTVIHRAPFLKRVRETYWKMAIIELSKLYGQKKNNNHYSLTFLMSDLITQHPTADWKNKISVEKIKLLASTIDTEEVKTKVEKLIELRDQHYAHTDKDPKHNIFDVKFYYEDCIFLLKKAEEIIQPLAQHFELNILFAEYKGEEMNNFIDEYMQRSLDAARYKMANNIVSGRL